MINLWKPEYLLNLDIIDEQHQHFFRLCGVVVHLAGVAESQKSSVNEVIKALGAMRGYAFLHFKTEEEIMLQSGFPGYLKHTGYHNHYLQKMMEFETGFKALLSEMGQGEKDNEMLRIFLKEMSEFIAEWWSVHIVTQDSLYAAHVKASKPRAS